MQRPNVGIGIIIQNAKGEILVGKRKGSHSPFYSIPGGHLEMGETFEEGIKKEVLEETGLIIENPVVIAVTNNLRTFESSGIHHVSVNMFTDKFEGVPFAVECFLEKQFYIKNQK